jgi:hypothetical protein
MGHQVPSWRWVHLFINGIYWGPHQLTERVDDEFMDSHFGEDAYHVIRNGPDTIDGNLAEWTAVLAACNDVRDAAPVDKPARYAEVEALIDLDNFIDYIICNTYAQNDDWCGNNWRAAKGTDPGQKWRFLIWDAEWTFRPGEHIPGIGGGRSPDPVSFFTCTGPTQLHAGLQNYGPYQQRFSDRIKKHFFVDINDPASGAFAIVSGADRTVQLFEEQMALFEQVIYCESARWGYMDAENGARTTPFTKSDPTYLPDKPYGDWDRSTAYRINVWLPERRAYFLSRMQAVGLYQP